MVSRQAFVTGSHMSRDLLEGVSRLSRDSERDSWENVSRHTSLQPLGTSDDYDVLRTTLETTVLLTAAASAATAQAMSNGLSP